MNERHISGELNQEDRCVKGWQVPSALVHMLEVDLGMLGSGLEGQGGFDRQWKGTGGSLLRLSPSLSPSSFPPHLLPSFSVCPFFSTLLTWMTCTDQSDLKLTEISPASASASQVPPFPD